MSFKKYFSLGKTNLNEKMSYFLEHSIYTLFIAVLIFVFFNMWKVIYGDKTLIGSFSFPQMLWYLALSETLSFSIGINRIEKIGEEVKSGSLVNTLLKPYHFLGRELAFISSDFLYNFLLFGGVSFILSWILVGPIEFTLVGLILTAIVLVFALVLNYFITSSFGLITLWTEDSTSIYWLYQKSVFILGGMLLPLEFYPSWAQGIIGHLPPAYIMYGPAKMFVHPSLEFFISVIIGQIVWGAIFVVIMFLIYRKAIREVNFNGG